MQKCVTGAAGDGAGASPLMTYDVNILFDLKPHQVDWRCHVTRTRPARTRPILCLQARSDK